MATETGGSGAIPVDGPDWISGLAAGLVAAVVVGVIVFFGIDATILEEYIPEAFGLSGAVAGWAIMLIIGLILGLVYAALTSIDQLATYANDARMSGIAGLAYGLALWILAIIIVPLLVGDGFGGIGEYAVTAPAAVSYALLGVLIGVVYVAVPLLRER